MNIKIEASWTKELSPEWKKGYFKTLINFVTAEEKQHKIFPATKNYFRALNACPFNKVKVVILGQDPYHGKGQANGLSFSVNDGIKIPPSLRNIFKELESDLNITPPKSGDLYNWAQQGVLLLNATLSVRESNAGSHQKQGWEKFTDCIIETLSRKRENIVFILWGAYAQKKGQIIDAKKHLVLTSTHPSPLSAHRGFLGNKHFSQTNRYLEKKNIKPITWG